MNLAPTGDFGSIWSAEASAARLRFGLPVPRWKGKAKAPSPLRSAGAFHIRRSLQRLQISEQVGHLPGRERIQQALGHHTLLREAGLAHILLRDARVVHVRTAKN